MIDIFFIVAWGMYIDIQNITPLQNYIDKIERDWYTLVHIASRVYFFIIMVITIYELQAEKINDCRWANEDKSSCSAQISK